jgi:hypothetical protein
MPSFPRTFYGAITYPSFPRKRESSVVDCDVVVRNERHWVPAFAGTTIVLPMPTRYSPFSSTTIVIPATLHIRHSRESGNPASLACDITVQIPPIGIHRFDHFDLPGTIPFLDLLFSRDRFVRRFVLLVPNQELGLTLLAESIHDTFSMLPSALHEIRCHAGIQSAVATIRE